MNEHVHDINDQQQTAKASLLKGVFVRIYAPFY